MYCEMNDDQVMREKEVMKNNYIPLKDVFDLVVGQMKNFEIFTTAAKVYKNFKRERGGEERGRERETEREVPGDGGKDSIS